MRVECPTFEEWLECLEADRPQGVWQNTVRYSIVRRPFGADRSSPKKEVLIQVSAVMQTEGGGEYLLEVGQDCGFNYDDATQDKAGDHEAGQIKAKLEDVCLRLKLRLLPGIIHA